MLLRVRMMASGEEVCAVPLDQADACVSAGDRSIRALKRHLQSHVGLSRFRQRLVGEDGAVLDDASSFDGFTHLKLVLLPFAWNCKDKARELSEAAARDEQASVETMLQIPQDPNGMGATIPLLAAASRGHKTCSEMLLEARAEVDIADPNTALTPLCVAAQNGHVNVVRLLLAAGAEKNKARTDNGSTPLFVAAQKGHVDVVRLLLEAGVDKATARTDNGGTPLYVAVQNGHSEVVRVLLDAGVDKDRARTDNGITPLCMAALECNAELVRMLLEAGADNSKARTDDGSTPLVMAAERGHEDAVRILLEAGADQDLAADDGSTPLFAASHAGHAPVVRVLLEAGADSDRARKDDGSTPLVAAAKKGWVQIVGALLEAGADKDNASNDCQCTPLFIATQKGHVDVVRMLLEAKADKEKEHMCSGTTPLLMAVRDGHAELVRLLLQAGADKDRAIKDPGVTPLLMASQSGHLEVVRLLLAARAAVDQARRRDGATALFMAAQNGHVETARLLVEAGADEEKARADGVRPMDLAALRGGADMPTVFSAKQQQSLRLLRESAGTQLRTPTTERLAEFSQEGQRLLSQITEARAQHDWMQVRGIYGSYTGTEVPIFNAVMYTAIDCEQHKEGAKVYRRLCNLNVTKQATTFAAALKIYAKLGEPSVVREIWAEAQEACALNKVLAAARIDAAASEGDVITAAQVLDDMNSTGVDIDEGHINSAIRACWETQGNSHNTAKFLFNFLLSLKLEPDIITFTTLIGAYATAPLDEAVRVLGVMKEQGVFPNRAFAEVYLTTALALKREDGLRFRTSSQLLTHLSERGVPQARLEAAWDALVEFKSSGVELSGLSSCIRGALSDMDCLKDRQ